MTKEDDALKAIHAATPSPGRGRQILKGTAAALAVPVLGMAAREGYRRYKNRKEEQLETIEKQAQYAVLATYGFIPQEASTKVAGASGALVGALGNGLSGGVTGGVLGGLAGYLTGSPEDRSEKAWRWARRGAVAGGVLGAIPGAFVGHATQEAAIDQIRHAEAVRQAQARRAAEYAAEFERMQMPFGFGSY